MAINVGKGQKLLNEVVTTVLTSSKPVQKTAASVSDTVEKLPLPSSSQVLAYHKSVCQKVQTSGKSVKKLLPNDVIEKRKIEFSRLNDLRGNDRLSGIDIDCNEEIFNRIKQCLFIKGRGKNQINKEELSEILKLSKEQYKMFSQLISVKNHDEYTQFPCRNVLDFIKDATPEQFEKVKTMVFAKGRSGNNVFTWEEIMDLSQKTPKEFERIKKLIFIPSRKDKQLSYWDIKDAANNKLLNDHEFKNALDLLSFNFGKRGPYSVQDIEILAKSDRACKRFKELHSMKELWQNENAQKYAEEFAFLSDFKFNVLKKLLKTDKLYDGRNRSKLSQIQHILQQKPERLKKILSYLDDKKLNISGESFYKLSVCENPDKVVSVIKKNPKIDSEAVSELISYSGSREFETIKPFLLKPKKYKISVTIDLIEISNKKTSSKMSIYKAFRNKEYVFEKPVLNEKKEVIRIIKTSQGTFIVKGTIGEEYNKFALGSKYKKLLNFPKNCNEEEIFNFIEKGNFKISKIFEPARSEIGHSNFILPQGSNTFKKVNGSVISQLDTTKSKNAERITIHYPDGRVATNDWDLNLSTTLEPNGLNNGMRIRKFFGSDKIDLTSSVENDIVTVKDNLTGKQLKFNLSDIIDCDINIFSFDKECISSSKRKKEIEKLMKKLSPTTILNLIKCKKTYPDIRFPFIKIPNEAQFSKASLTLSKCPNTTSHEAFHGIDRILDLTKDSELIKLHAKEAKNNKGLVSVLSSYATNGNGIGEERGLDELISIMGTMNEYGVELSERAEATRLAFPETTKAIEKRLMEYYKQTIDSLLK